MQFTTQARVSLFKHNFTKLISNVMCVSIYKQFTRFDNFC